MTNAVIGDYQRSTVGQANSGAGANAVGSSVSSGGIRVGSGQASSPAATQVGAPGVTASPFQVGSGHLESAIGQVGSPAVGSGSSSGFRVGAGGLSGQSGGAGATAGLSGGLHVGAGKFDYHLNSGQVATTIYDDNLVATTILFDESDPVGGYGQVTYDTGEPVEVSSFQSHDDLPIASFDAGSASIPLPGYFVNGQATAFKTYYMSATGHLYVSNKSDPSVSDIPDGSNPNAQKGVWVDLGDSEGFKDTAWSCGGLGLLPKGVMIHTPAEDAGTNNLTFTSSDPDHSGYSTSNQNLLDASGNPIPISSDPVELHLNPTGGATFHLYRKEPGASDYSSTPMPYLPASLPVSQSGDYYSEYRVVPTEHEGNRLFGVRTTTSGTQEAVDLGYTDFQAGTYKVNDSGAGTGQATSNDPKYKAVLTDGGNVRGGHVTHESDVHNLSETDSFTSSGAAQTGGGGNDFFYVNQLVGTSGQSLEYRIDGAGQTFNNKDRAILPGSEGDYEKTSWADDNHNTWTVYTHRDTGAVIKVRNIESVEFRGYYASPPAVDANGNDMSAYTGRFGANTDKPANINSDSVILDENKTSASTGHGNDLISVLQLISVDGDGKATPLTFEADGGTGKGPRHHILNHDRLQLVGPQSDWKIDNNVNHNNGVWNRAVNLKTGTTVFYKDIEEINYTGNYNRA